MKKSLGIYISNWNVLGGVESFIQNFCKRMNKHYKISLLFDWVENNNLLFEYSNYVDIIKIDKSKIYSFDYFINSTAWGFSPFDNIESKKVIQVVHADYRHVIQNWNFKYIKHNKTTHHVCVGQVVKEGFEEVTKLKCDKIIYNLLDNQIKLDPKPKNKILNLITCSRLSGEKGFKRMLQFAEILKENKVEYIWNVYGAIKTSYQQQIVNTFKDHKEVVFHGVTRESFKEINKADYLVQLSDTEGFAYSVYEAMQVKTPCIITPFASGNEQITHGVNGYIVPFDMKEINLKEILNNIPVVPEFEELGKEEDWIKLLES
jgi:glycosyltransferase involved in cell wall biosynthesis